MKGAQQDVRTAESIVLQQDTTEGRVLTRDGLDNMPLSARESYLRTISKSPRGRLSGRSRI